VFSAPLRVTKNTGHVDVRLKYRYLKPGVGCVAAALKIGRELKLKADYSQGHLYLGELYLNAGEKEKAVDNLKKAEGMFREMGMDYWLGRAQESLAAL